MLGAIIGDLAATTWQTDRPTFYKQLVSSTAVFTREGMYAYDTARCLIGGRKVSSKDMILHVHPDLDEEGSKRAMLALGLYGWLFDDINQAYQNLDSHIDTYYFDKGEFYARNIILPLIIALRNGATKDEALNGLDTLFRETLLSWDKKQDGFLSAIARAWDAFYRWYDFTSVIHSAVKSPVEPHLTAIVAGMLAQAMYGCEQGMIKRKYSDNTSFYIELPESYEAGLIRQFDESVRKFYPKNRALTNVELHVWKPAINPYAHAVFDDALYKKIRMALDTGWENRFGIYLDNGWYYVYRSHFLLARFKIVKTGSMYRIADVQHSDEKSDHSTEAMWDALYSIQCPPYQESDPPILTPKLK